MVGVKTADCSSSGTNGRTFCSASQYGISRRFCGEQRRASASANNHGSSDFLAGKLPHLRLGVAKSIPRSGTKAAILQRRDDRRPLLPFRIIFTDLPRLYACVTPFRPPMYLLLRTTCFLHLNEALAVVTPLSLL